MTILVTGATGFIGSQVARALVGRGHTVRTAVRPGSSLERLGEAAAHVEQVPCDLFHGDAAGLAALCRSVDLCVHAAWYVVPGQYIASPENLACVQGSLRLLDALADAGCRRAVFVGTCFEYDFDYGYLSEETPVKPLSLYAAAKASTRLMAEQVARLRDVDFTWVRLFYQYGPFEDPRRLTSYVIQTLLRGEPAHLTEGRQVRDFLHVADVGEAVAAVALAGLTGVVNVGSGQPVTVREIVSTIAALLGREDLLRFGARPDNPTDPPFICANNRRLLGETDWKPRFDLAAGLQDTLAWWQQQGAGTR